MASGCGFQTVLSHRVLPWGSYRPQCASLFLCVGVGVWERVCCWCVGVPMWHVACGMYAGECAAISSHGLQPLIRDGRTRDRRPISSLCYQAPVDISVPLFYGGGQCRSARYANPRRPCYNFHPTEPTNH